MNLKKMIKSLTKKHFHNYFSSFLQRFCMLLSQLFLIPAFILNLGLEQYGEWLILTTIPNYLLLSDLGLTLTVTNELCRLINLKEFSSQEKLFKAALSFLSAIGLFLIFTFLVLSNFIDFAALLNFKFLSNKESFLILLGFMINIFSFLIFLITIGYFKALNLFHKHEYFLALTLFLDFLATLIILNFNVALYFIPITMAVIRFTMIFIMNIQLKKVGFYKFGYTLKWGSAIKMLPVSLKLSFFQLGTAFFIQGSTFLVGMVLGSASVVVFNTIRTLVNSLRSFISILYIPTMQEFTILITKKLKTQAFTKLKKLLLLIFLISVISGLGVYFLRDFIFDLWFKNGFTYNVNFLAFMLLATVIHNLWNAASMLPISINRMNELAIYPFLGITVLVVQYFIIPKTGLTGLAISFIFMDLVMLFLVFKLNYKILKNF
ncbi:hypothetical protein LPB03_08450 [Polaribacter vadi]|uniref:Polysaccharide biosynthesis protein C-terminal domain-containing protein n=2 Tax=Polaribacter vadi TaxID=1774273 RepID=A0A1B8U2V5_9FLAO|nr:hypothetical protein LPB03_08450 [Polaribacter vadi]OBY66185.1 hypothetical protein LPB3_01835 [Polaribacter vadi]